MLNENVVDDVQGDRDEVSNAYRSKQFSTLNVTCTPPPRALLGIGVTLDRASTCIGIATVPLLCQASRAHKKPLKRLLIGRAQRRRLFVPKVSLLVTPSDPTPSITDIAAPVGGIFLLPYHIALFFELHSLCLVVV